MCASAYFRHLSTLGIVITSDFDLRQEMACPGGISWVCRDRPYLGALGHYTHAASTSAAYGGLSHVSGTTKSAGAQLTQSHDLPPQSVRRLTSDAYVPAVDGDEMVGRTEGGEIDQFVQPSRRPELQVVRVHGGSPPAAARARRAPGARTSAPAPPLR